MIKKLLILIAIAAFLIIPTHGSHGIKAQVLKAGVVENWTLEKARKEAFRNIEYRKNLNWAHAVDPNFKRNIQAINNNEKRVNNYTITVFYNANNSYGGYSIKPDNSDTAFYYNALGHLNAVSFGHLNKNYPTRAIKYFFPGGNLSTVSLNVNKGDNYLFYPNGSFMAHWINDKAYDSHGNVIKTREVNK